MIASYQLHHIESKISYIFQKIEEADEDKEKSDLASATHGGSKLDERSKVQKLKDRHLQKKKLRKSKGGGSAEIEEADEIPE